MGCKKMIDPRDLHFLLSFDDLQKYEMMGLSSIVTKGKGEFCYCPTPGLQQVLNNIFPDCGYIFLYMGEEDDDFVCEKCKKHYCLKCKCPYHTNVTCYKYRLWKQQQAGSSGDQQFLRYVQRNHIKQCPSCKVFVEKRSGCNSITCNCGAEFCYNCGYLTAACLYVHGNLC